MSSNDSNDSNLPSTKWITEVVAIFCIVVGNTVGGLVKWKCPKCQEDSFANEYSGNAIQGGVRCPKCGQDING